MLFSNTWTFGRYKWCTFICFYVSPLEWGSVPLGFQLVKWFSACLISVRMTRNGAAISLCLGYTWQGKACHLTQSGMEGVSALISSKGITDKQTKYIPDMTHKSRLFFNYYFSALLKPKQSREGGWGDRIGHKMRESVNQHSNSSSKCLEVALGFSGGGKKSLILLRKFIF